MSSFKQGNRRVLATDEWLRVEGCDSVYALGDCATINQRKIMVPLLFNFSTAYSHNKLNFKSVDISPYNVNV